MISSHYEKCFKEHHLCLQLFTGNLTDATVDSRPNRIDKLWLHSWSKSIRKKPLNVLTGIFGKKALTYKCKDKCVEIKEGYKVIFYKRWVRYHFLSLLLKVFWVCNYTRGWRNTYGCRRIHTFHCLKILHVSIFYNLVFQVFDEMSHMLKFW